MITLKISNLYAEKLLDAYGYGVFTISENSSLEIE